MSTGVFILHSQYTPSGDQPEAIARLISGIEEGAHHQTLKGITGSGKTFTMANVIHRLKRPTLILAPNKTLTAQLYDEMKQFFPENAVEYFVSYYDYFQPEVYLPGSDRFIPKDSAINDHLERLRLSTTKSLIERRDTIVVASVSSIYGMGDPDDYRALQVPLSPGARLSLNELLHGFARLQYDRTEHKLKRGTYRVTGDMVEVFPADSEYKAIRLRLSNGVIETLDWIDAATGQQLESIAHYLVSPKTVLAASASQVETAATAILEEMERRVAQLNSENRHVEAERLYERITNDAEMLRQVGYCSGMENYACYLSGRDPSLPPITLLDYLPKDGLLFVDESHVMIPQISAMYSGDQSRKDTLIEFGFRLPSSKNNHPLSFRQFEAMKPQTIFVSATPAAYELNISQDRVVDQIVRPTGLLDPEVEVRPCEGDIDDLLREITERAARNERVLVTTLTKVATENLHAFLESKGVRARYLHSDIKTEDRIEIINGLRAGEFDVLIGISLLREGLDIPEASLIAILNADRAGFLRTAPTLIQMIGRAARNVNGKAILYADVVTPAMKQAMDETIDRRQRQIAFNEEHGVTPSSSIRKIASEQSPASEPSVHSEAFCANLSELCNRIGEAEHRLLSAVDTGDDALAEDIRLRLDKLYGQFIYL
ncbi:excinuclease ABC subunit UvrB [Bradyrhizobium sp. U87765 SZCCT0131]|jgi:excinuclease ABC subunit B|uniref:Excinuclease ABC subunit B n=3 Tax=Alphaproteobacteria TaxID=28211 RepID=A0A7W5Z6E5_9HYPH|nr:MULTISPECIES: excinuclease ABC subunit UvrB [Alphaproteobacteria]MBB3810331.1 excinuclease ABC subunit B [Pseudochelatococcus contaminans]MBD3847285.1 excinuclease ABC subunit UvrB [Bosea spartocytisi]MBR1216453.1 excinuclease ABC subunit UvrB [Bradyrhizobium sp. U87765 SZCCT0131]MBR1259798.1 excinuclease ABC subunit UvrB [Bradyrhizobium sp. U87765 SZCCT0134]MBR1305932.1 excinuclease ABC subunit UvrB [Bradyrhizobium sp. U87765 SZCCT0110]